jgi:hypothetical protein
VGISWQLPRAAVLGHAGSPSIRSILWGWPGLVEVEGKSKGKFVVKLSMSRNGRKQCLMVHISTL